MKEYTVSNLQLFEKKKKNTPKGRLAENGAKETKLIITQ